MTWQDREQYVMAMDYLRNQMYWEQVAFKLIARSFHAQVWERLAGIK